MEIPVGRGKFVLVDADDFEILSQYSWYCSRQGYAVRNTSRKQGKRTLVRMHRQITNAHDSIEVDHINGNKLDNRKKNLRLCRREDNAKNLPIYSNNKSGHKGVSLHKSTGKWQAYINVNKKRIYLGLFKNKKEAVKVYNDAAEKYFGEFKRERINPMMISDIEKEVETFLDEKLDQRISASEFNDHMSRMLNLIVSMYNKHNVRMSADEAWDILWERWV
jgi:hypothetical protein